MSDEGHTMLGLAKEAFTGFFDYRYFYPDSDTKWIIVGLVFYLLQAISTFPQVVSFVEDRTNFGLSPLSMFCANLSQFFLMFNVICLQSADFCGLTQHPFNIFGPRLQTFVDHSTQWIMYLPIVFSHIVFYDVNIRQKRGSVQVKKDRKLTLVLIFLLVTIFLSLFLTWGILGINYGFSCKYITTIGQVCGICASVLEFCQFLPQLITTIKLRDNGSLSMLMMCIQMPSSYGNAFFIMLGQNADFTTYITTFLDATDQLILLSTCCFFKIRRWAKKETINKTELALTILRQDESLELDTDVASEYSLTRSNVLQNIL